MTEQNIIPTFDYSLLDDGVRKFVLDRKQAMLNRDAVAIIADGHDLLAIKKALGHGKFGEWITKEYWFSDRTARKRMQVAEMVNAKSELNSDFENKTISELYELAAAYHRPQIEAPEEYEERQEVEEILGDMCLEMPENGTEIDVAAMIVENKQLKTANATLETQLQDALRLGTTTVPARRHSGGHHGPLEKEQNGVMRRSHDFQNWATEEMTVDAEWHCDGLDMGVLSERVETERFILFVQNKRPFRKLHVRVRKGDAGKMASILEDAAKQVRKIDQERRGV